MLARPIALTAAALMAAAAAPAWAEDAASRPPRTEGWQVQVGGGALAAPDFQGGAGHRTRALPYVSVDYGDLFSASIQNGASLTLYRSGNVVAGPKARFRFGQDESDSPGLQGLGDVDPTLELGGFVGYRQGPFSAELSAGHSLAGGRRGATLDLSAAVTAPVARTAAGPVLLSAGPAVTFVTSGVNRAFFGVDPAQSAASGLPLHNPSGGLQQAGVNATLIVPVAPRVSMVGFVGYGRLMGDAADSPRVRLRGAPDQVSGGLFVTYALF